jgi:hypothetical protein
LPDFRDISFFIAATHSCRVTQPPPISKTWKYRIPELYDTPPIRSRTTNGVRAPITWRPTRSFRDPSPDASGSAWPVAWPLRAAFPDPEVRTDAGHYSKIRVAGNRPGSKDKKISLHSGSATMASIQGFQTPTDNPITMRKAPLRQALGRNLPSPAKTCKL